LSLVVVAYFLTQSPSNHHPAFITLQLSPSDTCYSFNLNLLHINDLHFFPLQHIILQVSFLHALCYKPEGCRFNSRRFQWNFSLTQYFWPYYGHGVGLASNRNESQEYFLGGKGGRRIGLKTLAPSCSNCLEIWEPQPPGTLRACPGLNRDCFTFYIHTHLQ
jgi:hypothetical protein